ncbi:MAG: hypothetical protein HZC01_02170 [Candidatus Kerfeldbacteria bacterium]|nr:hypothetical protein [Candidatus Kerfeldbacteria bacterium]
MEFTPVYIVIVYVLIISAFVFMGLLNIYHVIRFSHLRAPSIIMSLLFLVFTVGIILGTFAVLKDFPWNEPISISLPFINDANEGLE